MESVKRPSSNDIQGLLRLKSVDKRIGPLRPARAEDTEIQKISREISAGTISTRQLLLTSGFGIDTKLQIPVRLPALMIPGLQMMESMRKADLPIPTYLVYQATGFIAETNGISHEDSFTASQKMEVYLRKYVETFHPDIAEHVIFRFEQEYTSELRNSVNSTIEQIRGLMCEVLDVRNSVEELRASEAKHSNNSGHYESYAAANVLYSGAVEMYPFDADMSHDTKVIIPIGGSPEIPFFTITSHVSNKLGRRKIVPVLTPIAKRPTYYYYPDLGDAVTVDRYQHNFVRDGNIKADKAALEADGATTEKLGTIYPE